MKRAFLLLLFVPFLFSCSSEDDRLISEKLRRLAGKSTYFWQKLENTSDDVECITAWFQNGHVYSERCAQLSVNNVCDVMQDWYYAMPLDEITVLNETKNNIVFSYRDEIHEVLLFNNEQTVQLKYNRRPDYKFIVNKISESKLVEWEAWEENCRVIQD